MKRLISFLFWSLIFLLIVVGLDQLFVRVEMRQPSLVEIRTFYVDFRTRLLHLAKGLPATDIFATKKPSWPSAPEAPSMITTPAGHPPDVSSGRQKKSETPSSRSAISERTPR